MGHEITLSKLIEGLIISGGSGIAIGVAIYLVSLLRRRAS